MPANNKKCRQTARRRRVDDRLSTPSPQKRSIGPRPEIGETRAEGKDRNYRPLTVTASAPAWTKTYAYNQRGELITDTLSGGGGATSFGRDTVGRLNSLARDVAATTSDITTTYAYNPASQTVSESRGNDAYAFADRYNVSRPYTANGLNQYTVAGPAGFLYDANGNLTCDGESIYLYDVENRMVEKRAKVAGGGCTDLSGALQASLRYDPMGRLYETAVDPAQTATITRFLIDGDAVVGEYNSAGTLLRRYIHGAMAGSDDPIAWYEGSAMSSSTLRFLHADRQGSIVLAGDSAGNALRLFAYDEYGIAGTTGGGASLTPANGARFLYTGQMLVPELGMYYYKARIYSPTLGRFMQTDPIGYADQVNLYGYVGNDPVNGSDPSGMLTALQCEQMSSCSQSGDDGTLSAAGYTHTQDGTRIGSGQNAHAGSDKNPRPSTSSIRRNWVMENGQAWPKDSKTGRNQDAAHITARGDGGDDSPQNIRPQPHDEHVAEHSRNGDFRRWGSRAAGRLSSIFAPITTLTGLLSGRIRTDKFENFVEDVTGVKIEVYVIDKNGNCISPNCMV